MKTLLKKLRAMFGRKAKTKPPPWEDPSLPQWQRDMWIKAEPKSLKRGGA